MSSNRVDQRNITAAGNVAGGNIDNSITINAPPSRSNPLAAILASYDEEIRSGTSFDQIIDKLQHWHEPDDPTTAVIGVKEKLLGGDREDLIHFAIRAKELFTKCLARHQNSKAAQEIFAHLLAMIWQKFNSLIRPRILEGRSKEEIDQLIQTELIDAIENLLGSNPLRIDQSEISGMIYFLTGNCHLKWS
ncbi:MAG: hypothetical protein KF712_15670 [Akkermansiaceae bacterium]|nr:hypothetical protein [Akkermansiaceae bacterium]